MEDTFNVKRKGSGSAIPRESDPSEQVMAFSTALRNVETFALDLVYKAHPNTGYLILSVGLFPL